MWRNLLRRCRINGISRSNVFPPRRKLSTRQEQDAQNIKDGQAVGVLWGVGALLTATGLGWYVGKPGNKHHVLYTVQAAVCWPSNLLFMGFFPLSRYESKLYDLRRALTIPSAPVDKRTALWIDDLHDFQTRYKLLSCTHFNHIVETMLQLNGSNLYLLRPHIDWELIRVQPMRYLWNEATNIGLAAFLSIIGVAVLKEWKGLRMNLLGQKLPHIVKNAATHGRVLIGLFAPYILVANMVNLGILCGTYKSCNS